MITLREAQESGWEGREAQTFVTWYNKVEHCFEQATGVPLDLVFGDWPSADYYADFGDDVDAVVETLIEDARSESSLFDDMIGGFDF